jgi:hypothetical protein
MSDSNSQPIVKRVTLSNLYPDEAVEKAKKIRELGASLYKSSGH